MVHEETLSKNLLKLDINMSCTLDHWRTRLGI